MSKVIDAPMIPIVIDEFNRHFMLYAKGWYKQTTIYDDIVKIVAHVTMLKPEHVHPADVWVWIVRSLHLLPQDVQTRCLMRFFTKHPTFNAMAHYGESAKWRCNTKEDMNLPLELAIMEIMSEFANMRLRNDDGVMIEIGEPDYSILPKRQ